MIKFVCEKCKKEWYSSYEGNRICPSCGGELKVCSEFSIKTEKKVKLYEVKRWLGVKKEDKKEKKTKEIKKGSEAIYKGEMDKMKAYDQKFLT